MMSFTVSLYIETGNDLINPAPFLPSLYTASYHATFNVSAIEP